MKTQMNESPVSLPFKRERGVFSSSHGGGRDWPDSSLCCLYSKHSSSHPIRIHLHCFLLLTKLSKFSVGHNYTSISLNSAKYLFFGLKVSYLLPFRGPWYYFLPFFKMRL